MTAAEAFPFLQREIHTTVAATVDDAGRPVTCAIDLMDADESGLYFLTARGKGFYDRLKKRPYLAMTGMKGHDTLSCVAVSVRGAVRELGAGPLTRLFAQNPYMRAIYPTAESRRALTVFQLYAGTGEWFDLSKQPLERFSFAFGRAASEPEGYCVTDACTGCGACGSVCPQACIDLSRVPAVIRQEHCLHCGNCREICPQNAVVRRNGT